MITVAAWCWRLILIGVVIAAVGWIVAFLKVVVLPCVVALLLTALLRPVTRWLRNLGLNPLLSAWLTLLGMFTLLAGVGVLIGVRADQEFPRMVEQIDSTGDDLRTWLATGPFHIDQAQLNKLQQQLLGSLKGQQDLLVGKAATAATAAGEFLVGTILMLFVTFFLLKDGGSIWRCGLGAFGGAADRVDRAGRAAWRTLSQYMHGTVIIATIHSAVMATVLSIMGVPMVAALTMLIFFASFIPIIGIIVAGGLAVLVTFGAKGPVFALVLIGILLIEQQLENHVLQPIVVGKLVRLHPLAIILALAAGGITGGIPGAAFAVPLVAVISRALPQLTAAPDPTDPVPMGPEPDPEEQPAAPQAEQNKTESTGLPAEPG